MRLLILSLLAVGLIGSACSRQSRAPEPLPLDQFTAEIEKSYRDASPAAKELSRELAAAVAGRRFAAAQQTTEMLLSLEDLKPEQRAVANRALLTVMSQLREAQEKGDPEAAAAMRRYRENR
jgi:hypothetical protein